MIVNWILLGAVAAIASVVLNLLLGMSRVVLAMARRNDLPAGLARLSARRLPSRALAVVVVACVAMTAVGSVRLAWEISALTVLLYYAITNVCALRLPATRAQAASRWAGLGGCGALAVSVVLWHVRA
jgi:APA family basic amino acid/polyamine antiporter